MPKHNIIGVPTGSTSSHGSAKHCEVPRAVKGIAIAVCVCLWLNGASGAPSDDKEGKAKSDLERTQEGLLLAKRIDVRVRPDDPKKGPQSISFFHDGLGDDEVAKILNYFPKADIVSIHSHSISDKSFEALAALPDLTHITIGGAPMVTDNGMDKLKDKGLTSINLLNNAVSTKTILAIATNRSVKNVLLSSRALKNNDLKPLATCERLEFLTLAGCEGLTDQLAEVLKECQGLRRLTLARLNIGVNVLRAIGELKSLKGLSLEGIQINSGRYEFLQQCPILTDLSLEGCSISGEGLKDLCKLKQLTELTVSSELVPPGGLIKLKAELNKTQIKVIEPIKPSAVEKSKAEIASFDGRVVPFGV